MRDSARPPAGRCSALEGVALHLRGGGAVTWVRFEDLTPDHPKFTQLGNLAPLAGWLWFSATCYCMRYLTDGHISREQLKRLWPFQHIGVATGGVPGLFEVGDDIDASLLIDALCASGLLEKNRRGYVVHDFLEDNPSKAQLKELREKKAKAGQAGGIAKAMADAKARATPSGMPPSPPNPIKNTIEKNLDKNAPPPAALDAAGGPAAPEGKKSAARR